MYTSGLFKSALSGSDNFTTFPAHSAFSNRYRDEYKAAYKNKDTVTVAKIKTRLSLTGLYDDLDKILEDWRNAADEEVKKEKRAKEYAEKNK